MGEVAKLKHQQEGKELITSNCVIVQRKADYYILRATSLNCYCWAEFQWISLSVDIFIMYELIWLPFPVNGASAPAVSLIKTN